MHIGDGERATDREYGRLIDQASFVVRDAGVNHLDSMGRPIVIHQYGAFADEETWRLAFDYNSSDCTEQAGDVSADAVSDVNDVSEAYDVNPGGEVRSTVDASSDLFSRLLSCSVPAPLHTHTHTF